VLGTSELILKDYQPHSKLEVQVTRVDKPRFPVVDAHNHLGETLGGGLGNRSIEELLDVLDEADVKFLVDLDGGWGEDILNQHLDYFKSFAPDRFIHFGGVDWSKWPEQGDSFGEWAARKFKAQVDKGAEGLKIWKAFGLNVHDHRGELVQVDDERLTPLWETAAELKVPVMIHVADPVAFFDPLDRNNERWEELHAHPDWHFPSPPNPPFMTIMDQLANLVKRQADTTFIGAHVGCYSENLNWVSDLLDQTQNFFVDISARISELGRQPYSARKFFIQYADRILFGTDLTPNAEVYHIYYRFLETSDEHFNYSLEEIPPQGRWKIYGVFLPNDVLEKIYYLNAKKIFKRE
jgi:predicted TIM-barrel fold metal-dependent hydrolase